MRATPDQDDELVSPSFEETAPRQWLLRDK